MVLSNFTTTYQRDYSGDRSKAFRVQSARAPSVPSYTAGNVLQSDRPITRAGPEVNEDCRHNPILPILYIYIYIYPLSL